MARFDEHGVRITPEDDARIQSYRVRVLPAGEEFSYEAPYSSIPADVAREDGVIDVSLDALENGPSVSGEYTVWVTSAGEGRKESDPTASGLWVLDLDPLPAPTLVEVY